MSAHIKETYCRLCSPLGKICVRVLCEGGEKKVLQVILSCLCMNLFFPYQLHFFVGLQSTISYLIFFVGREKGWGKGVTGRGFFICLRAILFFFLPFFIFFTFCRSRRRLYHFLLLGTKKKKMCMFCVSLTLFSSFPIWCAFFMVVHKRHIHLTKIFLSLPSSSFSTATSVLS